MEDSRLSSPVPANMPEFNSIPAEKWNACEASIRHILNCVRPSMDSEDARDDVISYLRRIIKNSVNAAVEVFPYGSGPLKTYLPEGDIDLVVIGIPECKDLPRQVLNILEEEEQKRNEEFVLSDIRFINAEVKLIKCVVNSVEVDITFNQLSGLCALCFIELLDRRIGQDHLFKRSIILIKSWCYHESFILGSAQGFLSTYTLEILILNILLMDHASLTCPLMVLYKFLEYYSQFDWAHFGISIQGPFQKYSQVVVNPRDLSRCGVPELKEDIDMFTVPYDVSMANRRFFVRAFNIKDPLKENNNLGRSVSDGNSGLILSALRIGGGKLGEILQSPNEEIEDEIKRFFSNTLSAHPSKCILERWDILDNLSINSMPGVGQFEDDADSDADLAGLSGDYSGYARNLLHSLWRLGHMFPADRMIQGTNMFIPAARPQPTGAFGHPSAVPGWLNWARRSTYETGSSSGTSNNNVPPQFPQGYGFEAWTSSANGYCPFQQSQQSPLSLQGYGQSSAPRQGQTGRQLVFGSVDRVVTSPQASGYTLRARRREERDANLRFEFTDRNEFPPL